MTLQRISTTTHPLVTQQSDLDGVTYWFRFRWSERAQVWHMDLRTLNDEPIALSVALVTAWPLLRRCHAPHRPPGDLVLIDLAGPAEPVTRDGFGDRWCLFYIPGADMLHYALTLELPP
jgi:hypothetical protein